MQLSQCDVLIIGCGIAGATAALRLSEDPQCKIALLTREPEARESNSNYAQGGIATLGPDDQTEIFVEDILAAGAGLSYEPAVNQLAELGPLLVNEFLQGDPNPEKSSVSFDRTPSGELKFGLEAAHSKRRILHVGDGTGQAIMKSLLQRLAGRANVEILPHHTAVDILTSPHHCSDPFAIYKQPSCHGAFVLNRESGQVESIQAPFTLLSTGGLGQIYLNTSNPAGARGDGLAMAYRAGARLANCEYVQFHPTTFYGASSSNFLITEALRGEGALLLNMQGERFMERYEPKGLELAPRDVVARAIYWEMVRTDAAHMWLDARSLAGTEDIAERFPGIFDYCQTHGVDIGRQLIPVVPAAHYSCGGVLVDLNARSSLDRLYAIGEVACTGVHGANRLASTSLLEAMVWADRAAVDIKSRRAEPWQELEHDEWQMPSGAKSADPALVHADLQNLRNLMWHYVGLVRNTSYLERAQRELRHLWLEVEQFYRGSRISDSLIGLRNSVQVALIIAQSARSNLHSSGCHYREDGDR